jgi:CGNR zinc finger/Putative stress-induced transcription regulator
VYVEETSLRAIPHESSRKPAPGELRLVQDFANTRDVDDGLVWTELLPDAPALESWLRHHGLLEGGGEIGEPELRQAIAVREALRALLLANNSGPLDPAAVETVNNAAKSAELVVRFAPDGAAELAPVRPGLDGALGRLLAIAFRAMADGTWERLKSCPEERCGWAFYDHSRNRSSTWCTMKVCGNRAKARAYRERHRTGRA